MKDTKKPHGLDRVKEIMKENENKLIYKLPNKSKLIYSIFDKYGYSNKIKEK